MDRASQTEKVEATVRSTGCEATVATRASPSPCQASQSSFADGPSGEEVAKAFMSTQITNRFMRKKEQP
jgi:hypothetical protein